MRKKGEWGYNMPHGGERGRESGMTWHTERGGGGRRHPLESGGGGARKKGRGEGLVWDACPWAGPGKVALGEKEKNGPSPNE
jgi:hypothetical protein